MYQQLDLNLMCCEGDTIPRAYPDKNLLDDDRVLRNLLAAEENYSLSSDYFANGFQDDLRPNMRKIVVDWMFEVCVEQEREEEVFPLAVNYLDRFLESVRIRRTVFQKVGVTCMFLASKLKETLPMTAEKLVEYTDNSITLEDLLDQELEILHTLKWDLAAVTPQDFLKQIIHRLPVHYSDSEQLYRCAQTLSSLCAIDFKFAMQTPSMVAASSIAAAAVKLNISVPDLMGRLHRITKIEQEFLHDCTKHILSLIHSMNSTKPSEAAATTQKRAESTEEDKLPSSPTDVHAVNMLIETGRC